MDNDGQTNDLDGNHRRLGLLTELGGRQGEVHGLLDEVRSETDKSLEQGLAGNLGYDDTLIAAVALVRIEMSSDPDREVDVIDLIWAGEFLDHIDTQGFELRAKRRYTRRIPKVPQSSNQETQVS